MEATKHILVVEDDEGTRELLTLYLEGCGYTVTKACDGDQALGLLRDGCPYDLVLLDVVMPGTGGLAVLESMQGTENHCPVVLMTAWGPLQSRIGALRLGVAELLRKPFSIETLDDVVGGLLGGRHARGQR